MTVLEQFIGAQQVKLHIHMHWSADHGPSLYGFTSELEKTVFLLVIGCSGLWSKDWISCIAPFFTNRIF